MSISEMINPESSETLNGLPTTTKQQNGFSGCQIETNKTVLNSDETSRELNNNHQTDMQTPNSSSTELESPSSDQSLSSLANFDKEWPFDLERMYKIALKFFKNNDGKAFHCSYDQRNLMIAYTVQIKSGDYSPDKENPLGAFDFVGRDRRNAWISLQGMSKIEAETMFVNTLNELCESFSLFVMAIKCDEDEKAKKQQEEILAEKRAEEELIEAKRIAKEAEIAAQEEKKRKYEEQKEIIKKLLNQQTFHQFSSYAKKQYPNDIELQNNLITQLQDQHFQQYMLQMLEQSTDLQNLISNSLPDTDSTKNIEILNNSVPTVTMSLNSKNQQNEEVNIDFSQDNKDKQFSSLSNAQNNPDLSPNDFLVSEQQRIKNSPSDEDEGDYSEVEEYIEDVMNSIENASMWTRKDIVQFKESIKLEGGEGILTIGHGELATIRVPTHETGNCIFWEFATDSYDIGFGLFFEWNSTPDKQVSVHIAESDGEDDEEDLVSSNDPEKGLNDTENPSDGTETKIMLNDNADAPMTVIIPICRRESHNEVFAGSHNYPGKGVYLLKFDNTFSLWRSKTLYYRVYYTKEN